MSRHRDRPSPFVGHSFPARAGAGLVAGLAAAGLAIQARATFVATGSAPRTIWVLAGFFTIIANLLVAILFARIAAGRPVAARTVAGAMLAILLVGIVYAALLRGLLHPSGSAALADMLLHDVVPLATPAWWLAFAPKGRLRWTDPWWWTVPPLAYLPWALARGAATGHFAYPFLDYERHGPMRVVATCLVIAAAFVGAGFALVGLDRALARRAR